MPLGICEPANSSKIALVAMSSDKVNIRPTMVEADPSGAAKGSGMAVGKRTASLSPPKPRFRSSSDGCHRGAA